MKFHLVPVFVFIIIFCFVSLVFSSSASMYVELWLFACLLVQVSGIIPVCWQSKKTEGSVYADLNPRDLNCHLEYSKKKGEKKIGFTFGIIVSKNVKVHNGTSTYICQEELLWWIVLWIHHRSIWCLFLKLLGAWRGERAEAKKSHFIPYMLSFSFALMSPDPYLSVDDILPVYEHEELVALYFFGIIWSASKSTKKQQHHDRKHFL